MAAPSHKETAVCHVCGCESPLTEYFRKTRKGMVCPRCLPQVGERELIKGYVWLLVLGVVLTILLSRGLGYISIQPLIDMAVFVALFWVIICVHEGIHAATAWLLSGRVFEIALGVGTIRYSVRWRGVRFTLRKGLIMGLCIGAFPQKERIRLRWFLFIAAPLCAQALLVIWLLPAWRESTDSTILALILINGIQVATNLFPRKINFVIATDGYRLWEIFRGEKSADELHALYFVTQGFYAFEYEDYPTLTATAQAGLALYPHHELLRNQHAVAHLAQHESRIALRYFDQFLAEDGADTPSANRGLYLSNRAAALFQMALEPEGIADEEMARAYSSASEAYSLLPWLSPVEIVLALAFHFQGFHQAAIDLLEKALAHQDKVSHRAGTHAYIALAQHSLGAQEEAMASLETALRLRSSDDKSIRRIEEIVIGKAIQEGVV